MNRLGAALLAVSVLTFASTAGAVAIYTYTGLNYTTFPTPDDANIPGSYDGTMSLSGTFSVANLLAQTGALVDISGI